MSDDAVKNENGAADQVVGVIQGDRVCIACGFNLCGQRIVRESKYNLLIARCPECGQAAALQEYPLLGRWSNRWAATLAGLWLFLFFAVSIGAGMAIFGLTVGTTEICKENVQFVIGELHRQWWVEQNPDNPNPITRWSQIDPVWWESVDGVAVVDENGKPSTFVAMAAQTTWPGLFFAMLPIGCFGSVALLGVPKRRLAMAAIFPLVVAAIASTMYVRATDQPISGALYANALSHQIVWVWTVPMTIALGGLSLIIGMLIGRPLARLLVRTALPDRFVQSLAILWTSEGREPPKPRR